LKRANLRRKWSTIITKAADQLSKVGWSSGSVSAIDSNGRTIWIVDAHRGDGKRFVVREDEKLTVFVELERITRELALSALLGDDTRRARGSRLIEED
jgi:predicted type IV restriction endonuclease